jgi:hypothetical protein
MTSFDAGTARLGRERCGRLPDVATSQAARGEIASGLPVAQSDHPD